MIRTFQFLVIITILLIAISYKLHNTPQSNSIKQKILSKKYGKFVLNNHAESGTASVSKSISNSIRTEQRNQIKIKYLFLYFHLYVYLCL